MARERIAKAITAGTLPHTLLVAGPVGVGKQRFALWTAQRLLCERAGSDTEPCGECGPCHRILGLGHPDVHWFVPIQRPKAGEPDKQVDEAAETLGELMEARRQRPLWGQADGMWSHGIPSARLVLRRVVLTPVEAARKVIILGDAERLVAQAGAEDAANALLKVLEEPPADTVVILTAADPRRLLPTIRSRAVIVRLGRLSHAEVRGFLESHAGLAGAGLDERVATAEGSIGAALVEDGSSAKHRTAAESVLEAVAAGGPQPFERALRQPPFQARGDFASMLDALAGLLADAAREGSGQAPRRPVPHALRGRSLAGLVTAGERVQAAREAAQGNVNPQLLLATLSLELEEALCG
jgi:DNA polymerase-3 subunit delta'